MAGSRRRWYEWPESMRGLRHVPWKRLWVFCAAVFFLFCLIGFFDDLIVLGTIPYATTIVVAVVSGLDAILWLISFNLLPWPTVIGLVGLQFAMGPLLSRLAAWMAHAFKLTPPPQAMGIRFAAICSLATSITSYVFFVLFIRGQGREAGRIRNELELAHGIQKTLVPPLLLRTERFEVYGISQPSEQVGGDLVDAIELPGGDIIAYVADIAGHGLSAGILMGMLKTAARTALLDAGEGPPSASLPALLEKLNRVLPEVKEPQMYATLTAFRLDANGSAWYAMAASPPVLHWRSHGTAPRLMQEEQYPLGLLPVSGFTGDVLEMGSGDLVVVATDGVLEVCNRQEEEFGIERVERAIERQAREPLPRVAEGILRAAADFGRQADDQTLLVIRKLA